MHVEIPGNGFILRSWSDNDKESLATNASDRRIWDNVRDFFPHPYTLKDAEAWISMNHDIDPPRNLAIVIDSQAVGSVGLKPQGDVHRFSAEIGYWLGHEYWNRGIMTDAVSLMVNYGFEVFGFVRIYACVFDFNDSSMKVLEKAGFVNEGTHRKAVFKNDRFCDEIMYSIIRNN